ncbi:50S ribosomal protein L17 [Ignavibacteria bacterium]|nr:50S ribosomal protein L17 [Bacteroidota bacterium]MCZ2132877.1 50S ribosomal protein L17 [Bacteroidota bacterium]
MIHNRAGRKLKRTASHRKALLANLATSLFEHKRIVTTEAKAKELRRFAEPLITRAKHAQANEKNNRLTAGQTKDIHNRRIVARVIRKKSVLEHLFDTIAPVVEHRDGGYLRIVKLGQRRGDAGKIASIELVDFNDSTPPPKKKQTRPRPSVHAQPTPIAPAAGTSGVADIEQAPAAAPAAPEDKISETAIATEAADASVAPAENATDAAQSADNQSKQA